MATNQNNIQAINKMPQPTNAKDLQCFLGMINYVNMYPPSLAELGDGLTELSRKNVPFILGPEHTEAFYAIKK